VDSPALLPKDQIPAATNHIAADWDKRTRELQKKKRLQKQQARDRGEETDSDDDDEVAADVDWDVLEDEDTLTGAHPSMQGPFPFHAEGSESVRSVEVG